MRFNVAKTLQALIPVLEPGVVQQQVMQHSQYERGLERRVLRAAPIAVMWKGSMLVFGCRHERRCELWACASSALCAAE